MPVYADIAAIRIQSWLARTPRLKGRRGASAMLRTATDPERVRQLLPPDVSLNASAGDVDGVVSLVSDSADAAADAAKAVARHLRTALPQLELVVMNAEADDYFDAYRAMHAQSPLLEWQPAPSELGFARPCTYCGLSPAVDRRALSPVERDQPVCQDCAARIDAAGTTDAANLPDTTSRVYRWLREAGMIDPECRLPQDFRALAAGSPDPQAGTVGTHVATIFADGNRIGSLFTQVVDAGADKSSLARGINDATKHAVVTACRTLPIDDFFPATVHLAGGDDLLATVPAAYARKFTTAYLRGFEAALSTWARENSVDLGDSHPSASAGVVIHHNSHPFSLAVDGAGDALDKAKASVRGEAATICWIDVSSDAHRTHGPMPLTWLEAHTNDLDALAAMPASQRAVLERLPHQQIGDQVARRGLDCARSIMADPIGPTTTAEQTLVEALSLVRWETRG